MKRRQTTRELKAVAAYTELEGVQSQMDGEEESCPPFFLLQESHALNRFCTVDMAVTIKDCFLRAVDVSIHRLRTLDLPAAHPLLIFHPQATFRVTSYESRDVGCDYHRLLG